MRLHPSLELGGRLDGPDDLRTGVEVVGGLRPEANALSVSAEANGAVGCGTDEWGVRGQLSYGGADPAHTLKLETRLRLRRASVRFRKVDSSVL